MAVVQQDSSPPPPPHNHLFGPSLPHHPPFNLQTPRAMTIREHDLKPPPDSASLPQRYARPLPRANSDPLGQLLLADTRNGDRTEHLLRRKTPNGVLNAAYDGTSVEQMEGRRATKHIMLPISEHFPSNLPMPRPLDMVPYRQTPMPFDPTFTFPQPADLPPAEPWKANAQLADTPWNPLRVQHDSVLNQLPLQSPLPNSFPQNWQVYGYMPQPQQPSFVPTAMGSIGLYPSFWQNASYQFPAATQEYPSYHQYQAPMFPNHAFTEPKNVSSQWLGPLPAITASTLQYQMPAQFQLPSHDPLSGALLNNPFQGAALDPFSTPTMPVVDSQLLHSGLSRPTDHPSTTRPAHPPIPKPMDFGPNSSNARYRDRVYHQAVTIYLELIKHLNKHRAFANRGNALLTRYPKPPKQPIEAHPPPPQHYNSTGMIGTTTRRPSIGQRHSYIEPRAQSSADRYSWRAEQVADPSLPRTPPGDRVRNLRREMTDQVSSATSLIPARDQFPVQNAVAALESLTTLCQESNWRWIDGILLGGSLAYALAEYPKAQEWYSKILELDPRHVEAITNQAATLMAMGNKKEAEQYWRRAVKLRPGRFEAVEHLIALLCNENRNKEAIPVIEYVERSLRCKQPRFSRNPDASDVFEETDKPLFDYEGDQEVVRERREVYGLDQPGFGSSGYAVPGSENNRIHTLVHARGNLLYSAGDTVAAAKAFEEAVLITVGRHFRTIDGLVRHILNVLTSAIGVAPDAARADEPLLVPPTFALETLKLCFAPDGNLPGLRDLPPNGLGIKSAMSTTSNSLLSLAKIFQDGMASSNPKPMPFDFSFGVREILALYYLSLALQKSPSTANNVGILLAGLHQTTTPKMLPILEKENLPSVPGVVLGTGVSLALAYYNFGLNLDRRHAHLYTNLGSLLKDLGQLGTAIRMYEKAVECDQKFDIALANLANAVKDQGRIADAISYYQRAVDASPDFAEAVCGLANALNSVCGWQGRGGIADGGGARDRWHVDKNGMLLDGSQPGRVSSGWIKRVVDLVDKQLASGEHWGNGVITLHFIEQVTSSMAVTVSNRTDWHARAATLARTLKSWSGKRWEGQRAVRLVERVMKRLTWQWYHDRYVTPRVRPPGSYDRPLLPQSLPIPAAPTVLPFHTFTTPMSARQIRQISQRNGLRISCATLKSPWLPATVSPPPAPPSPFLKVGYVSSDFNNHPLAHLMQSVFGMHNRKRVMAYCYATTSSDNSPHRQQIERESPYFYDASSWSADKLVRKIIADGIHILVNLNGYTRGARNEVFAARPAPIQMSFMGFAGTLGAEWCDYLLADETAVPTETLRPHRLNVTLEDQIVDDAASADPAGADWIYGENIVYCRDSFFCCDHRQSAPDAKERRVNWEEELATRWAMRKEIFPDLPDDAIILGNFNQLYKIEPTTFRNWLKVLERVPRARLWLLRFPDLGEQYLRRTAQAWAGPSVAERVLFTDVAPKQQHISRARACDLFLDTPECNAHTTAADVLWSGTPLLTLPRYAHKMCSRMGASILRGALPRDGSRAAAGADPHGWRELVAVSDADYVDKAARLAEGLRYVGHRPDGRLAELRRMLWEGRWTSPLFDTARWVRDLEEAYWIAWDRWVRGEGGDIWLANNKGRRTM